MSDLGGYHFQQAFALGGNSHSDLKAVISQWGPLFGILLQAIEQSNVLHL